MHVIRACQLNKPILLEGSPGVGKTNLIAALASFAGHRPRTPHSMSRSLVNFLTLLRWRESRLQCQNYRNARPTPYFVDSKP
jgi:MoxR-like ATPase